MDSTSTLLGTNLLNPQVLSPSVSGGTAVSLVHTMTNANGSVLGYTTGASTSVTFATNGVYQWTCPTGITSVRAQVWGAGAGGDGGTPTQGGYSGGAGEYAEEPSYAVTPGAVYNITVGMGGNAGSTNNSGGDNPGSSGGQSTVAPQQNGISVIVLANGGNAGGNGLGGAGGSGSNNTIHWDGGDGANQDGGTGGAGGGSSAGPTSQGNNGNVASGSSGGTGGSGVTGGGAGGAGGAAAGNGTNGSAPGGGGGGAGANTGPAGSQRISYEATASRSWYGADAGTYGGSDNTTRVVNGTIYQGGETASGGGVNGTQKCAFLFPQSRIQSDWTGYTITAVILWVTCQHAWYSAGLYLNVRGWASPTLGDSLPSSWNGIGAGNIIETDIKPNARTGVYLPQSIGSGFAGQGADVYYGIAFGPGSGSFNLNYYGYFNGTPNNGNGPVLTLSGSKGGSTSTAGAGADGQVVLSYGTSSTPVYQLSVSAVTGTDSFGNPYNAGFTGPQLTVPGGSSTVATVNSTGVTVFNGTGTAATVTPNGVTSTELVLFNQSSPPSGATGGAAVFSDSHGDLKYIQGNDLNAYSTGRQTIFSPSGVLINSTSPIVVCQTTVATGTYRVHALLIYASTSSAGQGIFGWAGGAGTSFCMGRQWTLTNGGLFGIGGTTGLNVVNLTTGPSALTSPTFSNPLTWGYEAELFWNFSSGGTLQVRAQCTNASDTFTIASGSFLEIMPVS